MPSKDLLDADRIRRGLKTKHIGKKILVFDTVSSTNDTAAQYVNEPDNDWLVIIAEHQTAGKGRAGNKWYSEKGQSLLCSVLLINEELNAELLSLTIAVAAAEAIDESARIKWPNDIIFYGKKVAGILLESRPNEHGRDYIIGIGINCHQKEFPDELNLAATSIDLETGKICDRILLARRLLSSIEYWIHSAHTKPEKVVNEWKRRSLLLGQRITVVHDGREFSGNCVGIDPDAGLILQLDSGTPVFFPANQTTIGKQSF
jgi:BirA family biotin operon repressor/biotin-[acetyl-CoA-carboxylase] ligase